MITLQETTEKLQKIQDLLDIAYDLLVETTERCPCAYIKSENFLLGDLAMHDISPFEAAKILHGK